MMGILLTDKEYVEIVGYIPIPEHDLRKVNKAQLKKVVEWIVNECVEMRDPDTDKLTYYAITPEEVEALLKEAGLNKGVNDD